MAAIFRQFAGYVYFCFFFAVEFVAEIFSTKMVLRSQLTVTVREVLFGELSKNIALIAREFFIVFYSCEVVS